MIRIGILAGLFFSISLTGCVSSHPIPRTDRLQAFQYTPRDLSKKAEEVSNNTSPYADWSAVVVSADKAAAGGRETQAFDNARRDLAEALVDVGFARNNIVQLSASGGSDGSLDEPTPDGLKAVLNRTIVRAGEGCFIYLTSHGDRSGIVFGSTKLTPEIFSKILGSTCGMRPTVAVISACYSGVFLEPLAAPNRMILTASRPDRNSFGCGEGDRYPYFDACVLEEIGGAPTFVDLAKNALACVEKRESFDGLRPSEPQLSVGSSVDRLLKAKPLARTDIKG